MAAGATLALFASHGGDLAAEAPPVAATQKDYVGLTPAQSLACAPECNIDGLLYLWGLEHADARVVEKQAVYYQGVLIGYDVLFVE